ncbi:MAG: hypothetical protein AAF413_02675 [Patescibacteria group bacterium]
MKKVNYPKANFDAHRAALKKAVMQDYTQNYGSISRVSKLKKASAKMATLGGSLAVAALLVGATMSSPLTTNGLIAKAQASQLEQAEQGRYRYTVTKLTDTYNGKTHTLTTESWEDLENGDHKMITKDEDGNIVDQFMVVNGVAYSSSSGNNTVFAADDGGVVFQDLEDFDGAITTQEFVDSGEDSGYIAEEIDLSPEELEKLEAQLEAGIEDQPVSFLLDDSGNIIESTISEAEFIDEALLPEGVVDGNFAVEVVEFGGSPYMEGLSRNSTVEDRKATFERMLKEDDASLVDKTTWNNRAVVGIEHNYSQTIGSSSTIMYFDAESFRYVGSEHNADGFSFSDYVETEQYSDTAFSLDTTGLEKLL